jgi:cell division transport system permease protein
MANTSGSNLPIKISYLLHETWLGIKRGGGMNWAAVSTIAILLLLLGVGLQLSWQVDHLLGQLGSQLEISVYLKDEAKPQAVAQQIQQWQGVAQVEIVPKEQAWPKLLAEMGSSDLQSATELLGANPLANELKVRVQTVGQIQAVARAIDQLPTTEELWFTSAVAQGLQQFHLVVGAVGIGIIGLCAVAAIAVITTTIRLITVARAVEIEILHLVGATRRWISVPFLLQGLSYGVAGAVSAYGMLWGMGKVVEVNLAQQPPLIQSLFQDIYRDWRTVWLLPPVLLVFGAIVGMGGSWLAIGGKQWRG